MCCKNVYKEALEATFFPWPSNDQKQTLNNTSELRLCLFTYQHFMMKTSFVLLTAVLNGLAVADYREGNTSFICERSDASPYLHNVNEMIDNLNDAPVGENLCNPGPENGCGETNTGYSGSGGAAFMVCGPGMRVRSENLSSTT